MKDALEYAKYFIRQNPEHYSNTLEGNKKLNKLLIFADMEILLRMRKKKIWSAFLRSSCRTVRRLQRLRDG